jgi:hypothetical protein
MRAAAPQVIAGVCSVGMVKGYNYCRPQRFHAKVSGAATIVSAFVAAMARRLWVDRSPNRQIGRLLVDNGLTSSYIDSQMLAQ